MVRFRRLRLLRHDDVAALLPRRRQDHIAAQGLCRLRRRLRHAAGRLGPIRHLWRSIWQTPGPECGYFSHGIFNRGNRATADLRPSRGGRTHSARSLQALAGAVRRRRVGRIDLLHRGIRTGRTARIHRLLATGQRRLGLPAWFPKRRAPRARPFRPKRSFLGDGEFRSCSAFWSAFSEPISAGGSATRPSSPKSSSTGKSPRRR